MSKEEEKKDKKKGKNEEEKKDKKKEKTEEEKKDEIKMEDNNKQNKLNIPNMKLDISPLNIISDINSDMDLLSNSLSSNIALKMPSKTLFRNKSFGPIISNRNYNPLTSLDFNFDNKYDKEDYEMRELINRANNMLSNNNQFNHNIYSSNINNNFRNKLDFSTSNLLDNNLFPIGNYNSLYNKNNNYKIITEINSNLNKLEYTNRNYLTQNKGTLTTNNFYFSDLTNIENNQEKFFRTAEPTKRNYFNKFEPITNNINYNSNEQNLRTYKPPPQKLRNDNLINRTKRIEDLYKYIHNPRRKPMVYTQPYSFPINRNIEKIPLRGKRRPSNGFKTSYINNNNFNRSKHSLKFDSDKISQAIDILTGDINLNN